jgi:hypothetical protein
MERFNFKEINEVEDKEQYHVKISNRLTALENVDAEMDMKADLVVRCQGSHIF